MFTEDLGNTEQKEESRIPFPRHTYSAGFCEKIILAIFKGTISIKLFLISPAVYFLSFPSIFHFS